MAMRTRTLIVLLLIVLVAAFVTLNWEAIVVPTTLSLGLGTVQAPLGLTLLGLLVALTLVFVIYMAMWQATVLKDTRRHTKELQTQRALADQAEASRFTELRTALQAEVQRLSTQMTALQAQLEGEIRQNANSLSAMVGELDDRLQRRP
jgi:hypothetical protein